MLSFALIHLAPGDPVYMLAGTQGTTPDYIQGVRSRYGLDKPLHEQLVIYLGRVVQGDFGFSILLHNPVAELILERMPATVLLMGTGLGLATVMGVALGVLSSRRPFGLLDNAVTVVSLAGYSIPYFWSAIMLILVFAIQLNWLPSGGMVSLRESPSGLAYYASIARHLILPASSLAIFHMALFARLTRASMLDELRQDYVVMARSKGLPESMVLNHALRNAIVPVVTALGYQFGAIFGGSLITEVIFSWPGLGRLLFQAIVGLDYPIIMGMFIVVSVTMVALNLVADIVLAYLDPRITYK